jgi:hypothetical protein
MREKGLLFGGRRIALGLAATGIATSAFAGGSGAALAQSNGFVGGTLTATPVSGSYQIQQLFAGSSGQLWS